MTVLIYLGEFGIVYRGTLSGWRGKGQELIAVKTLKGTDELAEQREYACQPSQDLHLPRMLSVVCCGDRAGSYYHYIHQAAI